MANILIIKCRTQLSCEQLRTILDHLKTHKENGVILLPPYLEAQIVPDNIEIKLVDERGEPVE